MYVLHADSRRKRREKISGILGTNSSLGPAVHEGGKQSDTPFVGRPRLFDLGCSVRPAYMIRVHSPEAVTAGPWPRSILTRPRPGTSFCLINFLSGSTPANSDKRNRLARWPQNKKFGNAAKKKVRAEEDFFFFSACFLDVVFGRFESEPRSQIFTFLLPSPETPFSFSAEPA